MVLRGPLILLIAEFGVKRLPLRGRRLEEKYQALESRCGRRGSQTGDSQRQIRLRSDRN
jgi:hypothetical protein